MDAFDGTDCSCPEPHHRHGLSSVWYDHDWCVAATVCVYRMSRWQIVDSRQQTADSRWRTTVSQALQQWCAAQPKWVVSPRVLSPILPKSNASPGWLSPALPKNGSLVAQELCPGCSLPASGDMAPHGHLAGEMHAPPATEGLHARARARLEEILAYVECYFSRK